MPIPVAHHGHPVASIASSSPPPSEEKSADATGGSDVRLLGAQPTRDSGTLLMFAERRAADIDLGADQRPRGLPFQMSRAHPCPHPPTPLAGPADFRWRRPPSPYLCARCLQPSPPTPAALPCRIATISNIVRSSFPTHFRLRSALVAKRCLSSRPAAAFARTALTDVAVSRSFVRMNAEKISDTLFASPALRSRSPSMLDWHHGRNTFWERNERNRWYMTKASGTQSTRPGFDRVSHHSIRLCDGAAGGTDQLEAERKRSVRQDDQRFQDCPTSPLGLVVVVMVLYDGENGTLSGSVGSAGTTTIGRVELLQASPGALMTAPMAPIHPQYIPYESGTWGRYLTAKYKATTRQFQLEPLLFGRDGVAEGPPTSGNARVLACIGRPRLVAYGAESETFTVKFEKLAIDSNASTFLAFDEGDGDSTIPGLDLKTIKEGRSLYLTMTNKTKVAKGKEAQRKNMLTLDSGNTTRWVGKS
ncbi:hypothetical protein THAOC_18883 [Thalassiosira oceanica]|uniref:Uncharacterized protein n=1 Tax=Thalassiosira oceanica TaxID=159749 RepID=K0S3V6_THAOC|nr:hypothetical protein THAOC_18883 [Thalassiosira oceanica]|eukprot:EJK60713.1 hypothetical protein THAOC_18883 [Thalassiosira oceanica]